MQYADLGIDLGTASVLVYIRGKGVVLKEPSVVAYDRDTEEIKAIGEDARLMLGRTPGNVVAIRPMRQGVISNYTVTEKMLKHFIQKAVETYTVKGKLIDKATGEVVKDAAGNEITAETTFKPWKGHGKVKVEFVFDGSKCTIWIPLYLRLYMIPTVM